MPVGVAVGVGVGAEVGVGVGVGSGTSEFAEGNFSSNKAVNRLHVTTTAQSTISHFFIHLLTAFDSFYMYCFERRLTSQKQNLIRTVTSTPMWHQMVGKYKSKYDIYLIEVKTCLRKVSDQKGKS